MSETNLFELDKLSGAERETLMTRTEADLSAYTEPVQAVIDAVRSEGDAAVARLGREFDKADVHADRLMATPEDFEQAFAILEPEVREAIAFAVDNIRAFHEVQKPETMWMKETRPGVFAGERTNPIPSVACYVPRGKGAFPSVMMMTTIPAVIAGVPEIAVLTPPTPEGGIDAASLVAARMAGVERVYKCGGAVAVAAVAFGTETIPRCVKIVGPGSPWLVAAKRLLSDRIDTGLPAGPSESIVLADAKRRTARPPPSICWSRPSMAPTARPSWSPTAATSPRPRAPRSQAIGSIWAKNGSATPKPCWVASAAASCSHPTWSKRSRSPTTMPPSTLRC